MIHAGLYYPQDSFKAKFCIRGKQLLYDYCRSRNISYKNCGKLIVATQSEQLTTKLPALQLHAMGNGVHDTKIISADDVKVLEPQVECLGALWSPSTGVVDSHSFMLSLLADAEDHGATLALHSNLMTTNAASTMVAEDIKIDKDDYSDDGIHLPMDQDTCLQCRTVINSTGLWAHHVAETLHHYNHKRQPKQRFHSFQIPQQYYAKGNYFRLEGCPIPFQHLVYPLPEPGGLGVHATMDWSGQSVKFGPDVEWISADVKHPEDIDLRPLSERADGFYQQIRKYWPHLPDHALVPDYAGIRPKLNHPSILENTNAAAAFYDFQMVTPDQHGIPGLIHLLGMESPGLTSSMAIGEYIAEQVRSWDYK